MNLYNATCSCAFRADWLALDNQFVFSSLERDTSWHFSVACSSLCRVEALLTHFHAVWHVYRSHLSWADISESCQGDFMDIISAITRRHNLTTSHSLWFFGFYNISTSSSTMFPESQMWESLADASIGTEFYNSAFDLLCFFCKGLQMYQREVSLGMSEDYTYLWV